MVNKQFTGYHSEMSEGGLIAYRQRRGKAWELLVDLESQLKDVVAFDELLNWFYDVATTDEFQSIVLQFDDSLIFIVKLEKRHRFLPRL
jgi:hypothetical protein